MSDQADKLRQLVSDSLPCAEPSGPLPPTIVVTGGKGGVGTTTVALNLAVALATAGQRTVLVDAAEHPDAAQLAGIDTSDGPCLADVLAGTASLVDALRNGPGGLKLLGSRWAGEIGDRSPRTIDRLLAQLQSLHDRTDTLVIDAGSGVNLATRRFWQSATIVLVATAPDDMAVMDTYATIKAGLAGECDAELRVLVNQCDAATLADDVHRRLAAACHRFLGRAVGRAPRLPVHATQSYTSMRVPRAWEQLGSPFARSIHQLGRFASDLLSQQRWVEPRDLGDWGRNSAEPLVVRAGDSLSLDANHAIQEFAKC